MKLLDSRFVGESEILFTWSDDHRSLISIFDLRLFCPCAACRDEWTGKRILKPEKIPADIRALNVEPVGQYGVKIQFSDGHVTGIYGFVYLRELCPCQKCKTGKSSSGEKQGVKPCKGKEKE